MWPKISRVCVTSFCRLSVLQNTYNLFLLLPCFCVALQLSGPGPISSLHFSKWIKSHLEQASPVCISWKQPHCRVEMVLTCWDYDTNIKLLIFSWIIQPDWECWCWTNSKDSVAEETGDESQLPCCLCLCQPGWQDWHEGSEMWGQLLKEKRLPLLPWLQLEHTKNVSPSLKAKWILKSFLPLWPKCLKVDPIPYSYFSEQADITQEKITDDE